MNLEQAFNILDCSIIYMKHPNKSQISLYLVEHNSLLSKVYQSSNKMSQVAMNYVTEEILRGFIACKLV